MKMAARLALLALVTTLSFSKHLINDHLISPKASDMIERMGEELKSKTGIHAYVIATNKTLGKGVNLYEYVKARDAELSRPYIVIVFAPNSKRIGIVESDTNLKRLIDPDEVKRYAIAIVGSADKNSLQSKYDVAMVQAYSELADELAAAKGVEMTSTIKDRGKWLLKVITWLVYIGAVLIFWVYFGRPIYMRIRHGK